MAKIAIAVLLLVLLFPGCGTGDESQTPDPTTTEATRPSDGDNTIPTLAPGKGGARITVRVPESTVDKVHVCIGKDDACEKLLARQRDCRVGSGSSETCTSVRIVLGGGVGGESWSDFYEAIAKEQSVSGLTAKEVPDAGFSKLVNVYEKTTVFVDLPPFEGIAMAFAIQDTARALVAKSNAKVESGKFSEIGGLLLEPCFFDRLNGKCGGDEDGDGHVPKTSGGTDCNDKDPAVKPLESGDENCDGAVKLFSLPGEMADDLSVSGSDFVIYGKKNSKAVRVDGQGKVVKEQSVTADALTVMGSRALLARRTSVGKTYAECRTAFSEMDWNGSVTPLFDAAGVCGDYSDLPTGDRVCSVAWDGSTIWATTNPNKRLFQINLEGTLLNSCDLCGKNCGGTIRIVPGELPTADAYCTYSTGCNELNWDGNALWVIVGSAVRKISLSGESVKVEKSIAIPTAEANGIAWVSGKLHWVSRPSAGESLIGRADQTTIFRLALP